MTRLSAPSVTRALGPPLEHDTVGSAVAFDVLVEEMRGREREVVVEDFMCGASAQGRHRGGHDGLVSRSRRRPPSRTSILAHDAIDRKRI
jgi:hypothetical protein